MMNDTSSDNNPSRNIQIHGFDQMMITTLGNRIQPEWFSSLVSQSVSQSNRLITYRTGTSRSRTTPRRWWNEG
jgi:hypothetical protein